MHPRHTVRPKHKSHGVVAVACVQFTREISKYSRSKRGFCPTGGFGILTQTYAPVLNVPLFLVTPHANSAGQKFWGSRFPAQSHAKASGKL